MNNISKIENICLALENDYINIYCRHLPTGPYIRFSIKLFRYFQHIDIPYEDINQNTIFQYITDTDLYKFSILLSNNRKIMSELVGTLLPETFEEFKKIVNKRIIRNKVTDWLLSADKPKKDGDE